NGANEWLALGSTGTLSVSGSAYYVFDGWTGDVLIGEETNTVLHVLMQRAMHLTADFIQLTTSNGIPYAWIDQYYSLTNDLDLLELADTDGDSMTTLQEYTADTSPIVDTDRLQFDSIKKQSPTRIRLRFKSKASRRYKVYRSFGVVATNTAVIINDVPGSTSTTQVIDISPLFSDATYWLQVYIP
ncbi:MAG: hypothetical protein OSB41_13865, partial [Kiritimatiellae bacterium]|nr:hypothetical protein [Kiritimatiellia bacterium]